MRTLRVALVVAITACTARTGTSILRPADGGVAADGSGDGSVGRGGGDTLIGGEGGLRPGDTSMSRTSYPPVARFDVDHTVAVPGAVITFDCSPSTDAETPTADLRCDWDWESDGSTDHTGTPATHAFDVVGVYPVTLTVTDTDGVYDIFTGHIVVVDPADSISVTVADDVSDGSAPWSLREALDSANKRVAMTAISIAPNLSINLTSSLQVTAADVWIVGSLGSSIDGSLAGDCVQVSGARSALLWLELSGCGGDCVRLYSGADGAWIAHSRVHTCGSNVVQIDPVSTVEIGPDNELHSSPVSILSINDMTNSRIHGNAIYFSDESGIWIESRVSSDVVQIYENTIYQNAMTGLGFSGMYDLHTNIVIAHNTFWYNGTHGVRLSTGSGHEIVNNVFVDNRAWGLLGGQTSTTVGPNLYADNLSGACSDCSPPPDAALIGTAPKFFSTAAADFRVSPGSSCINQGTTQLSIDRNGPRPGTYDGSAPDLGAWESPW